MHHNSSMLIKVSTLSICLQIIFCSTNFFTKAVKSKFKKQNKKNNRVVSISLFVKV